MKTTLLHTAVCILLGFVGGFLLNHRTPTEVAKVIEVVRVDTFRVTMPVEVVKFREVVRIDTVFVAVVDTTTAPRTGDTVAALLPIERRVYADSLYRAVVSGYRPRLDSLTIYQRERVVQIPTAPSRSRGWGWGIGAQVGYGFTPQGRQPYCGVGVHFGYTF